VHVFGQRRGFSQPHVAGVQWGKCDRNANGAACVCADLLNKAGLKKDRRRNRVLQGADGAVLDKTPISSRAFQPGAMDENTLVSVRDERRKVPHWNGFPARIVVPG